MSVISNSVNASQEGVQYLSTGGVWSGLDGNTAGFVLTSNGTGVASSFQVNPASTAIQNIDGDSGSISGTTVSIIANQASSHCGSSVSFSNIGTVSTLNVTDSSSNTVIGQSSGVGILGLDNSGFGKNVFTTNLNGNFNNAFGVDCLSSVTFGGQNCGFGSLNLNQVDAGNANSAFGHESMTAVTGGSSNCAFGQGAMDGLITGSNNIAIGAQAGNAYAGAETQNILLGNAGVVGENLTIRIGSAQTAAFIAGVTGVTASNPNYVTINTASGQLGVSNGTNPALPAFMAYLSTPATGVTGDGTVYTLVADTTVFDQTASYNNGTGTFTAPQSGIYTFSVTISADNIDPTMTNSVLSIMVNGTQGYILDVNNPFLATATAIDLFALSGTQVIQMTAGDTLVVQYFITGGAAPTANVFGGTNPIVTQMSGYLVC